MKDFNIENLERKNSFKTPDNFFEDMQRNVLERVGQEQKEQSETVGGKIISLNWWYAAAASVAIVFGVVAFNNINNNSATAVDTFAEISPKKDVVDTEKYAEEKVLTEEKKDFFTFVDDAEKVLKEEKQSLQTSTKKAKKELSKVPSSTLAYSEVEVEQFIESMSQEDISRITQNNSQDIYLDLYY